ncbi:hypothetical protein TA3x_000651 [Tundrisphaera sp. TA3]|uniref:hypothetical protein n=1 Tax=Tundrisphaera sp. TA3 TaxID=3435775 RepID=UPI003EBDFDAC
MTLAIAPAAAPRYPDANVLVDGFATPVSRVPENAQNVKDREKVYFEALCPQNFFHAWIAEDVALMTLRLERCARIERRERDRIALRAERFWDDDRRREVEEVGARLADDPARAVARLRSTPHGCDWMIGRWALLANEIEQGRPWTDAHIALAHDLLGTHPDFRIDAPGLPLDPASLARREIDALRDHRATVAEADALDRSLAMADLSETTTPELRRLRRHEASLHKRLRWNLHQLQVVPQHGHPHPELAFLHPSEPDPAPVDAESEAVPEAEAPQVDREPGPARRPEPRLLKERARRQAKQRRADRLDT